MKIPTTAATTANRLLKLTRGERSHDFSIAIPDVQRSLLRFSLSHLINHKILMWSPRQTDLLRHKSPSYFLCDHLPPVWCSDV
jgi:hypothetical protein